MEFKPRSEIVDENQICTVYKFEDDVACFQASQQELDDTEINQDQSSSQAIENFKIIRQETYLILQQCDNFKELLTFAFKKQIVGHPTLKKNQQESQKIIACKCKTINEILFSKKNDILKLFLEERRQEEDQIQNQVIGYKQKASFASFEALSLFSRRYQMLDYAPNTTIYLNLYSDQLASKTLVSRDIFLPVERNDAVLSINIDNLVENQEFQISIRKQGIQIVISGPPQRGRIQPIQMVREKYIENVILVHWLKEQLNCQKDKIIVKLLDKYEIEFSTVTQSIPQEPKNSQLFMKLLDCVHKREGIQHYLEYIKLYIINQDYIKQKFNQIDATKLMNQKIQFETLQFFTRTSANQ